MLQSPGAPWAVKKTAPPPQKSGGGDPLQAIAQGPQVARLYPIGVRGAPASLPALPAADGNALRNRGGSPCEIIEGGGAIGKAQWILTKDSIAAEPQALDMFTADYDLPGHLPMGPHAGSPRNARSCRVLAGCARPTCLGGPELSDWAG